MKPLHALVLSAAFCAACAATNEPEPSAKPQPAAAPAAAAQGEAPAPDDMPAPTPPSPEHAWLGQLVGEWDVTAVASMGSGVEPQTFQNRTSARWIGGLWVVLESTTADFNALMTLGHDPARGGYTGTWVDSMTPTLWVYSGRLEEDGKALVLEAEGPNPMDPSKRMQGRDTLRILGPDHVQLKSAMKNDDGTWNEFMTADYRRRK
jgi:hypothetical protein